MGHHYHRQICYILVIGLTLVTIAVMFTYYNKNTNTSKLQKPCPRYSSVHFEESRDFFGPFMHIDGIVSLIDMANNMTTLCLGALVQNSTVLISYKCLQKFKMKVSEVDVYRYDESSSLFSRQNSFRTIISYQVSKFDMLVLLFLDEPFNGDETGLIALPKENSGKQCKEIGNATLVKFGGRLFPYEVKVLSGSDCFKHNSIYSQNQRSSLFCSGNSDLRDPEREEDPQFLFNNITYSDGQTEQALTGISIDVFKTGAPLLYVKVSYFTKWIKEIIDAKYT